MPKKENERPICDNCGKVMVEGYSLYGWDLYFCSDKCLAKEMTVKEFNDDYTDDGDSYYTTREQ